MRLGQTIIAGILLASVSTSVLAQDWVADRLRGGVLQLEGGSWVTLERGDVVPDGRQIRTLGDGRVELVRGQERIALAANTEIAIRDAAGQSPSWPSGAMFSIFQCRRRCWRPWSRVRSSP
jgi:hypothetical protein